MYQNDSKLFFVCHHHIDVVMQWHNKISMIVLFNTMNITYKFSAQQIVERILGILYSSQIYQKNHTSMIRPTRSNQALGQTSSIRTMVFFIVTRLRFKEGDFKFLYKNVQFIPFASTVVNCV